MRLISIVIVLLALIGSRVDAETRIDIDAYQGLMDIRVDADAPDLIRLSGNDLLPIEWTRNGQRRASLPAIATHDTNDLTIVDDTQKTYAIVSNGRLPQLLIDPQRYVYDANWHGQPSTGERVRIVLVVILFSLGLLLVSLVRRATLLISSAYCAAWLAGIVIIQARAPKLVVAGVHPEVPFLRVYAREADTLRFPIGNSASWVPVVESTSHLQTLSIRIVVHDQDEAELVADIPKGRKLLLISRRYAEGFLNK